MNPDARTKAHLWIATAVAALSLLISMLNRADSLLAPGVTAPAPTIDVGPPAPPAPAPQPATRPGPNTAPSGPPSASVDRSLHVCVPKPRPAKPAGIMPLVAERGTFWPAGSVLKVYFARGATPTTKARSLAAMNQWSRYAAISFSEARTVAEADIRCAFLQGQGSWSVIGTEARSVPVNQPTMNLGWIDDSTADDEVLRTVTHEAGHAIGLEHELESPVANIRWNYPAVYAWANQTQGWDRATTDAQIFARLTEAETIHTEFDPSSIMCYPVEKSWTLDGFEVGWNVHISADDAREVGAIYPKPAPQPPPVVTTPPQPAPPAAKPGPSPGQADDWDIRTDGPNRIIVTPRRKAA